MDAQSKDGPEIVTYKIPRIEVYQVTDDELNRIEEGYAQVGQDLTFATASLSAGLTLLIALLTAHFSEGLRDFFIAVVVICTFVCVYTGARFLRARAKAPGVIAKIRSRKTDPDVPADA